MKRIVPLAAAFGLWSAAALAADLSVDFGQTGATSVQPGFSDFSDTNPQGAVQVRNFGPYTVTTSGQNGFFFRSPSVATPSVAPLFNDFIYHNLGGTISFSIAGVKPNTPYEVKWWSFDNVSIATPTTATNAIVPVLNTTGPSGNITYSDAVDPTSLADYSFTGTFLSTTSTLNFEARFVSDNFVGADLVRINGFQLTETPEPGSIAIWLVAGLAGLTLLWRQRRSIR